MRTPINWLAVLQHQHHAAWCQCGWHYLLEPGGDLAVMTKAHEEHVKGCPKAGRIKEEPEDQTTTPQAL